MKQLKDSIWATLPLPDFRGRFFIESFWELLHRNTPHFYQARLMNVVSSAQEVVAAVEAFRSNERAAGDVRNAVKEFDACWGDSVAQEVFADFVSAKGRIASKCVSNDKLERAELERLRLICESIIARETNYGKRLSESLHVALTCDADLTKRERITQEIYRLTGSYITYLLNRGYSPTYLFNRMEYLTRVTNYRGRNFSEQLSAVFAGLDAFEARDFSVIFFYQSNGSAIPDTALSVFGAEAVKDAPEELQPEQLRALTRGMSCGRFLTLNVSAPDYVSAAWAAKERVDKTIDFVLASNPGAKVAVSQHCIASRHAEGMIHRYPVNIGLLVQFLASDTATIVRDNVPDTIELIGKLTEESVKHLGRSLRYLRIGRESSSLEQKLLNLWIALESLFEAEESAVIANIADYVPLTYAAQGVVRRIEYLHRILERAGVELPDRVRRKLGTPERYVGEVGLDTFFEILKDDDLGSALFDGIGDREHLKFRIFATHRELKTVGAVKERMQKTIVDVERQLRRLYSYRNKIAHTGHFEDIRPQLVSHLYDYVASCYRAIFDTLVCVEPNRQISLKHALFAYKMGADDVYMRFQGPRQGVSLTMKELIVKPVV